LSQTTERPGAGKQLQSDSTEGAPGIRALSLIRDWIVEGRFPGGARLPAEQSIAEELGVSRGTVRGALDKLEAEGLVVGTKGRGRSVVPGAAPSRSLMSQTVALLTCIPAAYDQFRRTGYMEAVDVGAADRIAGAGLHSMTLHPNGMDDEGVARVLSDPPLGIAVVHAVGENAWGQPILKKLSDRGVRLVVNGDAPELSGYDRVVSDHEAGSYELTRWLLSKGKRGILRTWTASPDDYWIKGRDAGYERAMREASVDPLPPLYVRGLGSMEFDVAEDFEVQVRLFAGYLVQRLAEVDAIMAVTDCEVYPIAAACRMLGKKPNKDVTLVGYDSWTGECPGRAFEKAGPCATVDKLNDTIGKMMVELLLDRVNGRLPPEPQRLVLAPELRVI
jgi:DNA-binding LacI/PurR family transcriptional regulator/DNA-binding transcriptional regulator YhcF (GntR family)